MSCPSQMVKKVVPPAKKLTPLKLTSHSCPRCRPLLWALEETTTSDLPGRAQGLQGVVQPPPGLPYTATPMTWGPCSGSEGGIKVQTGVESANFTKYTQKKANLTILKNELLHLVKQGLCGTGMSLHYTSIGSPIPEILDSILSCRRSHHTG